MLASRCYCRCYCCGVPSFLAPDKTRPAGLQHFHDVHGNVWFVAPFCAKVGRMVVGYQLPEFFVSNVEIGRSTPATNNVHFSQALGMSQRASFLFVIGSDNSLGGRGRSKVNLDGLRRHHFGSVQRRAVGNCSGRMTGRRCFWNVFVFLGRSCICGWVNGVIVIMIMIMIAIVITITPGR